MNQEWWKSRYLNLFSEEDKKVPNFKQIRSQNAGNGFAGMLMNPEVIKSILEELPIKVYIGGALVLLSSGFGCVQFLIFLYELFLTSN